MAGFLCNWFCLCFPPSNDAQLLIIKDITMEESEIQNPQQILNSLCSAITQKKCVKLTYKGHRRTVEVHAVGRARNGRILLRCYQVSGGSKSGDAEGWKLMQTGKITNLRIVELASKAPRPNYIASDPAMPDGITCNV